MLFQLICILPRFPSSPKFIQSFLFAHVYPSLSVFHPVTLVYASLSAFHPVFSQVYASLSTLRLARLPMFNFTVLPPFIHFYPVHAYFTPFIPMFTPSYPRSSRLPMSTLVYPHFTPFTHALPQVIHQCPLLSRLRMFYPVYSHVFPESSTFLTVLCLPQFTHVLICLPSMLTPVHPRSY